MPEIIRQGDKTSHGGTVLEGSPADICMGKPIAYIGHKVQCPKCKGTFPIVEGALTTTFYGKGVALAGMKTACGAVLIASQFTDIVEYGAGVTSGSSRDTAPQANAVDSFTSPGADSARTQKEGTKTSFDDRFVLLDDVTNEPLVHTEYAIRRASGAIEHGITDAQGHTHLLSATAIAEVIDIYI
ncbi:PAAR domain-containing protein [Massilia norwichensis]|jgi:uncharacterized Zn-binding protein involved in type VI secretion|uniref:PAAR domain-containing protein n=1 Tax=Massilia norwichensis TaxID=1442366 RepID=A0ABT2A834_9BURK|nr:PAAR domain-containing protein [Massilia norwichensis]MCS0590359.1 PAAR domain-containing protein [Massilia norwichensis]